MSARFGLPTPVRPCFRNIPEGPPNPKTVLVVGQPRGGTSAVAAALEALGVYMGDPCELRNNGAFESFVFVHGTAKEKAQEVERLNCKKGLWGWKQPFGVEALNNLPEGVHNLYCVFVFRDLLALLQSYRHHANASYQDAAVFVSQHSARLWEASQMTIWPSYLVSYERMKTAPIAFVISLCVFLGLDLPMHQKATAMARISHIGGYINMPPDYGWPAKEPPGCETEVL